MECDWCCEELTSEPIVEEIERDTVREGIYVATMDIKHFCSEECKKEYLTCFIR